MKYHLGPYVLDLHGRVLWLETTLVVIPPKAVEFLICLVEANEEVVPKGEIRDRVWPGINVEENSINQLVSVVRKALRPGFGDTEVIETVPRRGYRLAIPAIPAEMEIDETPGVLQATLPEAAEETAHADSVSRPVTGPQRTLWLAGALVVAASLIVAAVTLAPSRNETAAQMSFHPLTGSQDWEIQPDVSADGSRVVYSGKPTGAKYFGIFVRIIGGSEPTRLTFAEGDDRGAVWSPDHNLVAFSRTFDDRREIRVVTASEPIRERLILTTAPVIIDLSWSRDGKWLAYVDKSSSGDGTYGIFLVAPETGERKQLTAPAAERDVSPRFSPDGRWLAFIRYHPVTRSHVVYRVPADGGAAVRVTHDRRTIREVECRGLAWSQDGRDLLFLSDFLGEPRLYRVPAWSAGEPRWIEAAGFSLTSLSVSRETGVAAFTEYNNVTELWRVPGPGQPGVPPKPELVIASNRVNHSPRYSPDGNRIAFVSNRDGSQELWVANANGTQPVRLTSSDGRLVGSPAWSPDGARIAFDLSTKLEHPSRSDIYIVGSRGGTPVRFTRNPTDDHSPVWSRDGKWIFVSSTRGDEREIWRMPWPADAGAGRVEEKISHRKGAVPRVSPDGRYIYYAGKGPFTFWRRPVTGGAEEAVPEILNIPNYRNLAITSRGYYWARRDDAPFESIVFYDFAARKTRTLVPGDVLSPVAVPTLDASPDDKWVVFARTIREVHRVIVSENFH